MGLINFKKVKKENENPNQNVGQYQQMNQVGTSNYPVNNGYQNGGYVDPSPVQNVYPQNNMNQSQVYYGNMNQEQVNYQSVPQNSMPVQGQNPSEVEGGYIEVGEEAQNNLNYEAINNMRNIKMESSAPVVEEEPPKKEEVEELDIEEKKDEPKLDPLDNGKNPIPVNPIAVDVVVDDSGSENIKTGFFVNIGICIGLVFKPATTVVTNTKKYRNTAKAFSIYLWMLVLSLLLCIASRVVLGSFSRVMNNLSGRYQVVFDMTRIFSLGNYLGWLIATVVVSGLFVLLVALVYYASSFMNSKGISFGTYLMLATLGCVPITVGLLVLFPIGALFSSYFAVILLIISFLYGFFIFAIGAINVLKFSSVDSLLIYNLMNMAIIGVISAFVLVLFVRYTSYDLSYLLSIAGLG